jgi:hypothetical protein
MDNRTDEMLRKCGSGESTRFVSRGSFRYLRILLHLQRRFQGRVNLATRMPGSRFVGNRTPKVNSAGYNFAYSALALFRIGISGSASFQRVRKAPYAAFALALSPDKANTLPSCRCASAPMGSSATRPR